MIRVAIYARVSTEEQDLEGQLRELQSYAESKGWGVGPVYKEKVSATGKVSRAEYDRLRVDSHRPSRSWDHLLVWALDRWSREDRLSLAFKEFEDLEAVGVKFHSFREPYLDTPADGAPTFERELMRAFAQLSAKWESKRRSERVRVAAREIKAGRRVPRGKWGPAFKVDQRMIRRAEELRKEGRPWSDVAVRLKVRAETIRSACHKAKRGLVTFPEALVPKGPVADIRNGVQP